MAGLMGILGLAWNHGLSSRIQGNAHPLYYQLGCEVLSFSYLLAMNGQKLAILMAGLMGDTWPCVESWTFLTYSR